MKLDAIERLVMSSPLELTHENPIGLVTSRDSNSKSDFISGICHSQVVPNIVYYDGLGDAVPYMVGKNLVYKSTKTKDLFMKLDDICRFTQSTGFKVPTLVLFEELQRGSIFDLKFQNDLAILIDKCQQYDIYLLFVQSEDACDIVDFLTQLIQTRQKDLLLYRLLNEDCQTIMIRVEKVVIVLSDAVPHISVKNLDELGRITLWVQQIGKYARKHFITMQDIGGIRHLLGRRQVHMAQESLTRFCEKPHIYVVDDEDLLYTQELESWLRTSRALNSYFVLVCEQVPDHLITLVESVILT